MGFLLGWFLFGEFAWGDRARWPEWLRGLPTIQVSLLPAFATATLVLILVVRFAKRAPLSVLGINLGEFGRDVRWTLRALPVLGGAYLILGALAVAGVYLFVDQPWETIRSTLRAGFFSDYSFERMVFVLVAAPVLEEIWYRGMLYTPLRRERGRRFAIVATTLMFAFSHATMYPVTQLLGGLIFAWAYESRRTLVAPVLLHMVGNGTLAAGGFFIERWNLLG